MKITRREFNIGLASSLLLSFWGCSRSMEVQRSIEGGKVEWTKGKPKVIVVGGGISGLIAGVRLTEASADVTIVESEPQVGGRVYSEPLGGTHANLGAQYFFMSDNSYLNYYVKKVNKFAPYNGLHGALWNGKFVASYDDSFFEKLPIDESTLLELDAATKKMQKVYKKLAKSREFILDKKPESTVWLDLDSISASEYLSDYHPDVTNFFNCFLKPEGGIGASGTSALLLVGWYGATKGDGTTYLIEGGNQNLPEAIASDIKDGGNNILLSTGVDEIKQSETDVSVHCNNGEVLKADYVIVTTPATVAKKIVADLPKTKNEALNALKYGASMQVGLHLTNFYPEERVASCIFHNETINAYMDQSKKSKKGEAVISINISGKDAHELNDDGIINRVTEALIKIHPHFDPEKHIERYSIKKWPDGIAIFPAGLSTHYQDALRAPVGRVYFGGDYTHNPALDGAAWAGVRSAEQLLIAAQEKFC
jgi:monoamine oxidase